MICQLNTLKTSCDNDKLNLFFNTGFNLKNDIHWIINNSITTSNVYSIADIDNTHS